MRFESFYPFLLVTAPFAIAFFLEAVVIYFFRLKQFWSAAGISILVNLLAGVVLYSCSRLLEGLGYVFSGLQLPLQVILFLWWLSILADGLLLQLFIKGAKNEAVFLCALVMNTFSWLFLYLFIISNQ